MYTSAVVAMFYD
jgi:hypothetical protein